ncbi:MAG: acyltransferase [Deltaproteobacteria bacterium]|nr:MAG: acyltransferase [Deltaproteobacteria bacterium]
MPLAPLAEPKSFLTRAWGFAKGFVAISVLLPALVLINVMQTLSAVLVPISRPLVRQINRFFANFWWSWVVIWSKWYGVKVHFHGDDVPERENALVVCNHQEMSDILTLFFLARAKKSLGDLKFYAKNMIKYVPGIGWGMLFLDCIFLKRNWTSDHKHIEKTFDKINRYKIPLWLVSYVEGTRARPSKIKQSQEFAKKAGLVPSEHVLIPRTKGFVATMEGLRNHLDAVYDLTIAYEDGVPSLWQWAKGYVCDVHIHVRRFPTDNIPEDSEELSQWLIERYQVKDKLLDSYYKDGEIREDLG